MGFRVRAVGFWGVGDGAYGVSIQDASRRIEDASYVVINRHSQPSQPNMWCRAGNQVGTSFDVRLITGATGSGFELSWLGHRLKRLPVRATKTRKK